MYPWIMVAPRYRYSSKTSFHYPLLVFPNPILVPIPLAPLLSLFLSSDVSQFIFHPLSQLVQSGICPLLMRHRYVVFILGEHTTSYALLPKITVAEAHQVYGS